MVDLAYNYFKKQQNLPVLEEGYENEPVSRNAVTEIRFASPELVSILVTEAEDYLGGGLPIESITLIAENSTTRRLELSEIVNNTSGLLELVTTRLESETENETITLSEEALNIFTLSPTGITFHIPADIANIPFSFQNSYTVTLPLNELESINPSMLELLR
jgi:hypothetical protein